MDQFAWLSELEEFSPAALTVRAQTVSPTDDGRLLWDAFMPRYDAPSIRLAEGSAPIYRPTADRREWNQRGRYIPMITPKMREMVMVPIEATNRIDEEEMQYLFERFNGNVPQQLFRDTIKATIPQRVVTLVESDYRRIELDVFEAWANGRVVQKDPQLGNVMPVSFGFDAGRYQTAGTAWSAGGINAYDEFIAWLREGIEETGGNIAGVMLRLLDQQIIAADAPVPLSTGIAMNMGQLSDQISQDLGQPFRWYVNERTVHQFDDGGTAYTQVKVWPQSHIALVPSGEAVGRTHFAPVTRAVQMASAVPDAQIDVRGVTIAYESANGGRELILEGQVNALPVPNEQLMWVMDTLVTP